MSLGGPGSAFPNKDHAARPHCIKRVDETSSYQPQLITTFFSL